ncbi:MAG TPA: DUF475 domain-containing protein [Candidatus Paceibacterota bacterium]|nr:DUF475 domain-containing protein [Candidatus Paceibacterota bacterium]
MAIGTMIITVLGLCLFEIISSVDNAVINAEILSVMKPKSQKWFMLWGFLFAVIVIRGFLPWIIIWATVPSLGPIGSLTAAFSNNSSIHSAIALASPILLIGGGVFLIFLFFHWLFLEEKNIGLRGEKFFQKYGAWFFAIVSVILAIIVWYALKISSMLAFGAVIGSTAFFITHGFKENAEKSEQKLLGDQNGMSDISKILYLEIIDATFSVDGVLGAFAFTLSVPLIIIGNGLGAYIMRKLTLSNINNIKKYAYLKNGAMYSIFALGIIMLADSFGFETPSYISPLITFLIISYFVWKSIKLNKS